MQGIEWPEDWAGDEGWTENPKPLTKEKRSWAELDAALKARGSSVEERIQALKAAGAPKSVWDLILAEED